MFSAGRATGLSCLGQQCSGIYSGCIILATLGSDLHGQHFHDSDRIISLSNESADDDSLFWIWTERVDYQVARRFL